MYIYIYRNLRTKQFELCLKHKGLCKPSVVARSNLLLKWRFDQYDSKFALLLAIKAVYGIQDELHEQTFFCAQKWSFIFGLLVWS